MNINKRRVYFGDIVRHAIFSWLLAVLIEYSLLSSSLRALDSLEGLKEMSLIRIILIFGVSFVLLVFVSLKWNTIEFERYAILGIYSVIAVLSLISSFTWPYLIVCILIGVGLLIYCKYGFDKSSENKLDPENSKNKVYIIITAAIAVVIFLVLAVWTACRVFSFSTPTYDFGLFAQMFYYMKETGLPLTTLERDGLLSHFYVHVSPIYYLMLPFYMLVPHPATIQVLQAAVIVSAVIPLWKICKLKKLPNWQTMLMSIIILTFPALSGGVSYDIHENCFLTPLILWTFYGVEKRSSLIIAISALLTLCVKEDAAVYVAVIALWIIVSSALRYKKDENKMLITGISVLAVSLIWFLSTTTFLSNIGDGVMTSRYNNFMYDGSGSLITVIKSVILNPMKAVFECVDKEKLEFIALTLLPLLGLPLITRKYDRYILLIPYILLNLMSDYQYQHNIYFQYVFGSLAFLMYLTIINLADLKLNKIRAGALVLSAIACFGCFSALILPKAYRYVDKCISNQEEYDEIREYLSTIPDDATVGATTFYSTYLSQRKNIYDVKHCSIDNLLKCEYVVFESYEPYMDLPESILQTSGYESFEYIPDKLIIYKKTK